MSKYLLTYEDAQEISKRYNNKNFWESQHIIKGYKVATFNYFICGWDDFENPLPHKPEVHAFDMRGTTFVFNKDGSLWKRFLMLPKFFNLNQVEATQYDKVKNKEILNISTKEDGSLVAFMLLPDGKLFSKTIGSFVSEQSEFAYVSLYKDSEHVQWVKTLLSNGLTPLFEYVSWDNRIVLKYSSPELRFIGVRDNHNGKYFPGSSMNPVNIPKSVFVIPNEIFTLDELIEKAKTEENKEGWVVQLPDDLMKVKTAWYFRLHGLRTENVFREDYVIQNYLLETLDDIMSQLNPKEDLDAFKFVEEVTASINNYMDFIDRTTQKLKDRYNSEFKSDWVPFATSCHKNAFFGLTRTLIENPVEYNKKKVEMILKNASKLKGAKNLVDRWKNKKVV